MSEFKKGSTSKMGHDFENSSFRKMSHFENISPRKMSQFEKRQHGKLTTPKIVHLEMDHFENGTFRKRVTSKIDDFENESLKK